MIVFEKYYQKFFSYFNDFLNQNLSEFNHLPKGSWSFFFATLFKEGILKNKLNQAKQLVVITENLAEAQRLYNETQLFIKKKNLYIFPELDGIPYEWSLHDISHSRERIKSLYAILKNQPSIFFIPIRSFVRKIFPVDFLKNIMISVKVQDEFSLKEFSRKLMELGYLRTDKVENPGEFSVKGEILDIYPINLGFPIRIDYFDTLIESIRYFDIETQKSIKSIKETEILPIKECILNKEQFLNLKDALHRLPELLRKPDWIYQEEILKNEYFNSRFLPGLIEVVGFYFELKPIWEFFQQEPFYVFCQKEKLENSINSLKREFQILYQSYQKEKIAVEPSRLIQDFSIEAFLRKGNSIQIHYLHSLDSIEGKNLSQIKIFDSKKYKGSITEFKKDLYEILEKPSLVIITSNYDVQMERISFILKNENFDFLHLNGNSIDLDSSSNLNHKKLFLRQSELTNGFYYPEENLYILTDFDIFGKTFTKKIRYKTKYLSPIDSYIDLKESDFVVHINHGIGRFLRLERLTAGGRTRDYLVIEYADNDMLYVSLDQISMVQRYVSPEENPKLDHLGKASFKKIREKVEKNIEEFAKELMEIYAARLKLKGYAFPPDSEWQEMFEAEFPYEETPDQIRAIQEIKEDMESDKPMDRLVCGDVGYGKTEVAIRAIFKCVMAGKQAALICPTTILARQHFNLFKERFSNYPIRIDWISSLRTPSEIRDIKAKLKNKEIDVIIGTHALLSQDTQIPELGLLVIDEEQRFGVVHKEKLKKMKKTVDVLTLSATPIPRTLHMSLIGIRDLSIINTPPKERKPVETFVLEDSDQILKEAILKELQRGGQIFYLHNEIKSLNIVAERLRSLIPDLKITLLHSQMNDKDIDTTLSDFLEKKYDILITTTIIENGIDMPNVNTLIVDNADRFGLSQLYQLRGRVGRSSRQAYAYFFYNSKKNLTEESQKRLNTLIEYQELGSGFKISMKDLEIRGAGNILGKEQSGDIIQIGYELYIKLLEKAIKKLKGEKTTEDFRCIVSLPFDFLISESYIQDTRQKIEFYKKFESCRTKEEYQNVLEEMFDRFGEPDKVTKQFILIEKIRTIGTQLGIEFIIERNGEIQIQPSSNFKVSIEKMLIYLKSQKNIYIKPGNNKYLFFDSLRLQYLKKKKHKLEGIEIKITEEDLNLLILELEKLILLCEESKKHNESSLTKY